MGKFYTLDIRSAPGLLCRLTGDSLNWWMMQSCQPYTNQEKNLPIKEPMVMHLLVPADYGKMGAAVLSTEACLKRCGITHLSYSILWLCCNANSYSQKQWILWISNSFITKVWNNGSNGILQPLVLAPDSVQLRKQKRCTEEVCLLIIIKPILLLDARCTQLHCQWRMDLMRHIRRSSAVSPHPKGERVFGATDNEFVQVYLALQKQKNWTWW